ncbi:MAG TPA: cobalt ECF transporter T component CbiQ [Herpetosiphonaceae bacterium]|nr:cobalt ECF transporter T component CbiQ [Herpetosiphonaceae bacterium]
MIAADTWAYANRLRDVDPAQKLGCAAALLVACLALNTVSTGLVVLAFVTAVLLGWARVPSRVFARVLLAEGAFVVVAIAGVALTVGGMQPFGAHGIWIGALFVGVTPEGLALAALLASRTLGAMSCLTFVAFTTPLPDTVVVLQRLRVPPPLIELVTLIYRFVFVLLETVAQLRLAQEARLGSATLRRRVVAAGQLVVGMWLDAYRRAQAGQRALESRGYDGVLRILPGVYRHEPRLVGATGGVVLLLIVLRFGG